MVIKTKKKKSVGLCAVYKSRVAAGGDVIFKNPLELGGCCWKFRSGWWNRLVSCVARRWRSVIRVAGGGARCLGMARVVGRPNETTAPRHS